MSVFPRDGLYRASYPALEMRGEFGEESPPVMQGHFAIFDSPTEINSLREGNFMETIAPGAFRKTFAENRSNIKVLFQHGRDPQIGDKPLGSVDDLREDDIGGFYSVPLLDTSYNRDLLPGLRAGLYGASFRFQVMRESINKTPGESASNPRGIPERIVREASVAEFGPVTFPAYAGATAGVRSITDTIVDVDVLARAGAVVFDQERMKQCQVFISRGVDPDEDAEPTLEPFTQVDAEDDVAGEDPHERLEELLAEVEVLQDALDEETRGNYSADQRKQMAAKGHAMPDGSYPIGDAQDVKSAASLVGHSKKYSAEQVKAHVIKNARRLGAMSALPESWNMSSASAEEVPGIVREEALESPEQDAPPVDSAEPSLAHPIRGRRDKNKSYLRKDKPSWQL